jgi:hypothetical protein
MVLFILNSQLYTIGTNGWTTVHLTHVGRNTTIAIDGVSTHEFNHLLELHLSQHLQSTLSHNCEIVIIFALLCIGKECLSLLYFCFGEKSDLVEGDDVEHIDSTRDVAIVTGIWVIVMLYAVLLYWRAYERSKCTFLLYLVFD